jgi:hypothetical protein
MQTYSYFHWMCWSIVVILVLFSTSFSFTTPNGKVGIYGIRMTPENQGADNSRPNWGGGIHVVVPAPQLWHSLEGVIGLEYIDLMHKKDEFRDGKTQLLVEHRTTQHYVRLFLGSQMRGYINRHIQPHAGLNLTLTNYGISTDVVIPDDRGRDYETRQNLWGVYRWQLGYDLTIGVDFNYSNKVMLDVGVRYLNNFSEPQQLGGVSATVYPQYVQIYLGFGVSFNVFRK